MRCSSATGPTVAAAVLLSMTAYWRSAVGARILAVEPFGAFSNWNFMRGVLDALLSHGHEVTVFTPFPDGADRENYTVVDMSGTFPVLRSMELGRVTSAYNGAWTALSGLVSEGRKNCDGLHADPRFREIALAPDGSSRFDAIVVEFRPVDCLAYIAAESNLPLIYTVPASALSLNERVALGEVSHPAAIHALFSDHTVSRTFAQRLAKTASMLHESAVLACLELWWKTTEPRAYDARPTVPPSLVFVNGHFVSDPAARPTPANVVVVGGIHMKPLKSIPKDIFDFIDDSPHGVILFTFGSTIRMSTLPPNIQKAFIEALAKLPQRVLLKYESKIKDKPDNIMTKKWFPQRDILKHPKVKLFISHGGLSGMYEAVDAGVPVLGFPLFWDQPRNINNLIESGMAKSMELFSVTEDTFLSNVLELLKNETYLKNAKAASEIFNSGSVSSEKLVNYWTEYVIRHKGAPHLRSNGLNLTWYQYFLLDVIGVLLIVFCTMLFVIKKFIKFSVNVVFKCLHLNKIVKAKSA